MDKINSYTQNEDGSYSFNVDYHSGEGTMGNTVVVVKVPEGVESLTYEEAVLLASQQATVQRDHWIAALGLQPVSDPVQF